MQIQGIYSSILRDVIRLIVRLRWAWKNDQRSEFFLKFRISNVPSTTELRKAIQLNRFFPYAGHVGESENMEKFRNMNARIARKETTPANAYRGDHLCVHCDGTGLVKTHLVI